MILHANSRGNGQELAQHLLNAEDNEHVFVHEVAGFMSNDLYGAFREVEAISFGTKCNQYLFSLSLSPPIAASVSVSDFEAEIAVIEQKLGLVGQPRAVVFHEKKGRRHAHCVWSRIDAAKMRAINLSHYKRKLTDISRELYIKYDWEMPAGLRDKADRDPHNFSHAEAGQAKRVKRDPIQLKKMFRACWEQSDSKQAFAAALLKQGYHLARGDRRGFVAIDHNGEIYSLSRWCGVKTKLLRARLGDGSDLLSVEDALVFLKGRAAPHSSDTETYDSQVKAHKVKLKALVAKHRDERLSFQQNQEQQRIDQITVHQSQLPKGMKLVWAKLTGAYQKLVEKFAASISAQSLAHERETQALIERHLAERHALNQERDFIEAQRALFAEAEQAHDKNVQKSLLNLDPKQPLILPRDIPSFTVEALVKDPTLILDHLSQKQANFTRNDIVRGLAEFINDPLDLRVATEQAMIAPQLIKLDDDGISQKNAAFTTIDYQDTEHALSTTVAEMAQSGGFTVNERYVSQAINRQNTELEKQYGASLSDEQITAIRHILKPNQLSCVVGLAGTGKSTLLSVTREAWEHQGLKVHGIALAGKAADSLEKASSIPSRTIASLEASWKSGYEPVNAGDVVVLDEAGMVGTRQLKRVIEQLQMRGCKLVLIGDPAQLQPIEAGTPFKDISENTEAAKLTEIRRQKSDWQRLASRDLAAGNIDTAMQNYADHGAVQNSESRDHAITKLVEDYMADVVTHGDQHSRLALAHRRIDVHAINQAIRAQKVEMRENPKEFLFNTDHGPRAFAKGDRIIFTRNDHGLGVRNGMLGTVVSAVEESLTVKLDSEDEKRSAKIELNPARFSAIDHGYAVTIHRAQGCTVDQSFVLSSKTLDQHLAYVALSRHRSGVKFYSASDIEMKQSCSMAIEMKLRSHLIRRR